MSLDEDSWLERSPASKSNRLFVSKTIESPHGNKGKIQTRGSLIQNGKIGLYLISIMMFTYSEIVMNGAKRRKDTSKLFLEVKLQLNSLCHSFRHTL